MQVTSNQHYLPVFEHRRFRKICLTEFCPPRPKQTLLCLPGLLETSNAWDEFVSFFSRKYTVYVLDYAGRGLSERISDSIDYKMSSCLYDICSAISFITGRNQKTKKTTKPANSELRASGLHLIGNSMGGLLAATVAADEPIFIKSVVINDVGAIIPWSGLLSVMGAIYASGGKAREDNISYSLSSTARDLDVDIRLLRAVMRPSYADLGFRQTIHGMSYEKYFSEISAPILLIYSSESHMVTNQVLQVMNNKKDIHLFPVDGSQHPVPYTTQLNHQIDMFISQYNQDSNDENNDPESDINNWFERFKGKNFL